MSPLQNIVGLEDDIAALADVLPLDALMDVLQEFPQPRPLISVDAVMKRVRKNTEELTDIVRGAVHDLLKNSPPETAVFEHCIELLSGKKNPLFPMIKTAVQELLNT